MHATTTGTSDVDMRDIRAELEQTEQRINELNTLASAHGHGVEVWYSSNDGYWKTSVMPVATD